MYAYIFVMILGSEKLMQILWNDLRNMRTSLQQSVMLSQEARTVSISIG